MADSDAYETERLPISPWAVISACLGVAALFSSAFGIVVAIFAIISGHAARRDIKNGIKSGNSWATAGLGLGYVALILAIVVIVLK